MDLITYKYSDLLINLREEKLNELIKSKYEQSPERIPKNYNSNAEALDAIRSKKETALNKKKIDTGKKTLDIGDVADILIDTVAFTAFGSTNHTSKITNLVIYNYDSCIYEFDTHLLNVYIVELLGYSSESLIRNLSLTLIGKYAYLAIYNPLPKYKIAVGNGIYNCLTRELEPFTPEYTVLTKIKTNYIKNAKAPRYNDGFTYEQMCRDFANNDINRIKLLSQICKSIVTGVNIATSLFIFLGQGGDGKSTFFMMIANMLGRENVAFLNFSEIHQPDKMVETLNKKLVLGLDNDVNLYIKQTATLKSIASHEVITLSRKYLSAISVEFSAVFVQLCNEMPRFAETRNSMKRRLVSFKAENSHYLNGTENVNIDSHIKDQRFLEYVLSKIIDDPYYANYNDVDSEIVVDNLKNEDIIGQFLEDMIDDKIISSINEQIPMGLMYALYVDWMNEHNPQTRKLGSRGFYSKFKDALQLIGYSMTDNKYALSSILNKKLFYKESLKHWADKPHVIEALENSQFKSKCIYKEHDINLLSDQSTRRLDYEIEATAYFKVENELQSLIDTQPELRKELSEEITKIENTIEINMQSQQQLNDIELIYTDESKLEHYIEIVNQIEFSNDITINDEIIESLENGIKFIALSNGDSTLLMYANSIIDSAYQLKKEKILSALQYIKKQYTSKE